MKRMIVAAAAMLLAGTSAAAGNLVVNGDFEADASGGTQQAWAGGWAGPAPYNGVTGWQIENPGGITLTWYYPDVVAAQTNTVTAQVYGPLNGYNNGLTASPTGGAFMALDGDSQFPGSLSQVINGLVVGKAYKLSFSWAGAQQAGFVGPTWDKGLTASFGGQSFSTGEVAGPQGSFQPWTTEHATFIASASSQTLSFLARGMPSGMPPFVLLDGISLTAAVPEPASWAMLIMGFGMVGAVARRRGLAVRPLVAA